MECDGEGSPTASLLMSLCSAKELILMPYIFVSRPNGFDLAINLNCAAVCRAGETDGTQTCLK